MRLAASAWPSQSSWSSRALVVLGTQLTPWRASRPRSSGAEIVLDPCLAQRGGAGFGLAAIDRQLGGARLAKAAGRRVPLEPGGDGIVVGAGARQFGAPPHLLLRRPVRVLVDKGGNIGESGIIGRAARVIEPANQLQRQRVLALPGEGVSLGPIAAARAGKRRRNRRHHGAAVSARAAAPSNAMLHSRTRHSRNTGCKAGSSDSRQDGEHCSCTVFGRLRQVDTCNVL